MKKNSLNLAAALGAIVTLTTIASPVCRAETASNIGVDWRGLFVYVRLGKRKESLYAARADLNVGCAVIRRVTAASEKIRKEHSLRQRSHFVFQIVKCAHSTVHLRREAPAFPGKTVFPACFRRRDRETDLVNSHTTILYHKSRFFDSEIFWKSRKKIAPDRRKKRKNTLLMSAHLLKYLRPQVERTGLYFEQLQGHFDERDSCKAGAHAYSARDHREKQKLRKPLSCRYQKTGRPDRRSHCG